MAIKKITASYNTGASLTVTVIDDETGNILDDTDGIFRAEGLAADIRMAIPEHLVANGFTADIKGLYEHSGNRVPWPDGDKTLLFRKVGSDDVIWSDQMRTEADTEVPVDTKEILDRLGAFTGTGENTVLGFFKAQLKKDAEIPSDIGGSFNPATDSQEALQEKLVNGVTISTVQVTNGVLTTAVTEGSEVLWKRGDADRLTVNLGSAYAKAGSKFYLCIKANQTDNNTAAIVNAECTITDASNVVGYIDLTAAQMAMGGKYYAEIERRDADGASNPRTCWEAVWRITQDTRQ
ncbi:MAG TPA: hypothetical protein DCS42_04605 [Nitrospiraceae bacterium]|nr:hypothetical protein [Nitrospiraceae bacterium]